MTFTPEAVLQIAQIAILTGIFRRLGVLGEATASLKQRVTRVEDYLWSKGEA